MTGDDGRGLGSYPTTAPGSTTTQTVTAVRSGRCADSRSRYGLRRAPSQVIDWTWDEGTVLRVLEDRVEREALPAILGSYEVIDRYRHDLRENDVIRVTDTERGLVSTLAVISSPPTVGTDSTTIDVRIPR
jgi:hypothetical protein